VTDQKLLIDVDHAVDAKIIIFIAELAGARVTAADADTARANVGGGAEQTVVTRIGVVGVSTGPRVAGVIRTEVAIVAVGVVDAVDALIVGLVAYLTRTGVAAADAQAARTDIDGCAEQPVVTGIRVVGVLANARVADVIGAYIAVVAVGVAGATGRAVGGCTIAHRTLRRSALLVAQTHGGLGAGSVVEAAGARYLEETWLGTV
jgi:hypothetical protein